MKTKKVLYNIISDLSFELVAFVCGLLLPKIILEAYGSAYNGVIQTILRLLSCISILTLGVNGPTRVAVYKALAAEDDHKLHGILKANEVYMAKVGLALIGYMVFLAVCYPYLVRNHFGWWEVASLVMIIGLGEYVSIVFGSSSRILLKAVQKTYIYTTLMIGSKIASTVIAFALVKKGCGIHYVRMAMVACFAVAPLLTNYITKRMYHINSKVNPDYSAIKQRGDAIAHSLTDIVSDSAPTVLLTLFTNPIMISIYSVYSLILNNILKIQKAFTSNLEGAFGEFWAKGEKEKFSKKFCTLEYLMFAYLLLIYTTTMAMILPFMRIYTAGVTDANYILPVFASLFVCSIASYSLRTPYIVAVQAAGKYRDTKKMVSKEAVINITVSLAGILLWGLNGVVLGSLVANLYRVFGYAYFCYRKMLDIPMVRFVKRMVWMIVNGVAIIGIQVFLVNNVMEIADWIQWAIAGFVCVCVAGVILLVSSTLMCRKDLMNAIDLVKVMLSRKKK